MASFTESKHPMFPLHLFPLPSVCPGVIIFFKEPRLLMTCLNRGTFIFVVFASSNVSGIICSGPTCSYFWWSRGSVEFSSQTVI